MGGIPYSAPQITLVTYSTNTPGVGGPPEVWVVISFSEVCCQAQFSDFEQHLQQNYKLCNARKLCQEL